MVELGERRYAGHITKYRHTFEYCICIMHYPSNVINLTSQFRCPLVLEKYPKIARLPFNVTIFRLAVAYCHVNVFFTSIRYPVTPLPK